MNLRGLFVGLSGLLACGEAPLSPCAKGFGRDASGDCVAVGAATSSPSDGPDPSPSDTGTAHDPGDSAEPDLPEYEVQPATWSSPEVEAELADFLAMGVPDPFTIFDAWRSMFAVADPACPGGDGYDITSTASGCVSDLGWVYAGQSSYEELESPIDRTTVLSSDGYIISPDSGTMIAGGTIGLSQMYVDEVNAWYLEMEGSFGLDSSPSPWLSQSPSLAMYFGGGVEAVGTSIWLTGGWGLDGRAVYMELEMGHACPDGSGTIQLRDPSGAWHTLTLDCSTCGPLHYADDPATEDICVDLAPLLEFQALMEADL